MKPGIYSPSEETDREKEHRQRFYAYRDFLEGKRDTDPFEVEEAEEFVQGDLFGNYILGSPRSDTMIVLVECCMCGRDAEYHVDNLKVIHGSVIDRETGEDPMCPACFEAEERERWKRMEV